MRLPVIDDIPPIADLLVQMSDKPGRALISF
jgi:hypothetical protein